MQIAQIPRSTFYYHLKALKSSDKYEEIKSRIIEIYNENCGRYGYRRVTLALRQEAAADNVLKRNFKATRPNEKWVTDVTEFAVNGRKLYLSPIIDLFNNEVISYSISERPAMAMIDEMLDKAFAKLDKKSTPILHSDQGWQYRHRWYQYQLKASGVVQSMSRRGNCLDNACAECFFGTLKSECFYLNKFNNIEELKTALSDYIHYYNNQRISIKLKGLSPVEYRLKVCSHPVRT